MSEKKLFQKAVGSVMKRLYFEVSGMILSDYEDAIDWDEVYDAIEEALNKQGFVNVKVTRLPKWDETH